MNKLTEIKERVKSFNDDPQLFGVIMRVDEMNYLISILEEKDKALKKLADDKNYILMYDTEDKPWKYVWFGDEEQREIARKALNTSSNNEGEKT